MVFVLPRKTKTQIYIYNLYIIKCVGPVSNMTFWYVILISDGEHQKGRIIFFRWHATNKRLSMRVINQVCVFSFRSIYLWINIASTTSTYGLTKRQCYHLSPVFVIVRCALRRTVCDFNSLQNDYNGTCINYFGWNFWETSEIRIKLQLFIENSFIITN